MQSCSRGEDAKGVGTRRGADVNGLELGAEIASYDTKRGRATFGQHG